MFKSVNPELFAAIVIVFILITLVAHFAPKQEISLNSYHELKIIYLENPSSRPLIDEALLDGKISISEKVDIETFIEESGKRFLLEAVGQ
ncbi:hypothetical protein L4C37_10635 [Vibrio kagoshimensis]|uniref:hypothetical protein n=1 Tax=Vibrio kagoshimensis TaxID=2910244 RepID=UPI003D2202AD